jgi:hypothetical protein
MDYASTTDLSNLSESWSEFGRELTEQFLLSSHDIIRRSSVQLQRNVNAMPAQHSHGDKTPLELIIAGVRGWGSWRWRRLENSQST